jgi:DNA-binding GntR family transcriptional regulator
VAADPMYRKIADDLRSQIETGGLPPGSQLLTELELREKYTASRNTVRDAIKWLITRGLVETRPGQGTFVVEKITPFVITLTGDPQTGFGGAEDDVYQGIQKLDTWDSRRPPRLEIQNADSQISAELQLAEGGSVVSRHQPRFIKAVPWALQTSFYPMWLVERGATELLQAIDMPNGTVRYLADKLDIKQAGWRDTMTVRAPNESETVFFKLPEDGRVSVIETRRTAFDAQGRAVRLTVTVYPADRNKFAINVGQVPADVMKPPGKDPAGPAQPADGAADD